MRIAYTKAGLDILVGENIATVIALENTQTYVDFLISLCSQFEGNAGDIIFSDDEKEISLTKEGDVIFNPILVNANDKKILNKLYQELQKRSENGLIIESAQINAAIINYLEKLSEISDYDLQYGMELDLSGIFKLYDLKLNVMPETLAEKVIEYIKAQHRICHVKLFIFVHMKDYFTEKEIEMIYEFAFYEKVFLVILESKHYHKQYEHEKCWILDSDKCLIEVDELTV